MAESHPTDNEPGRRFRRVGSRSMSADRSSAPTDRRRRSKRHWDKEWRSRKTMLRNLSVDACHEFDLEIDVYTG